MNKAAKVIQHASNQPTQTRARNHNKVGAGRPTILTYEKEKEIVYTCQVASKILS